MKLFKNYFLGIFVIALITAGCAQQSGQQAERQAEEQMNQEANVTKAVAQLHATDGNQILGTVMFEKVSGGINVAANVTGLEEGEHGFHIHQFGDCTAADQTSAGGHYNPYDMEHGAPTDSVRHMGDMGNLLADADGNATLENLDQVIELNGTNSIIGRAVIIHGGTDDFTSQPSGAAGPRIACGVIGIANSGE